MQARPGGVIRTLIFVCLALVSISASAQVLHFHADDFTGTAKHCPICPILHSAASPAHGVQLDFSFQITAFLSLAIDSSHKLSTISFALFSRPPPLV